MPSYAGPQNRRTRDLFGRAWTVVYTDRDGSEYGALLPGTSSARHTPHHGPKASHHNGSYGNGSQHKGRVSRPGPPASRYNPYSGERIAANDGMADNPLAQALFHSRAGGDQWQASYRFVRNATAGYAALAFMAFFAPEILGGSSFMLRWSLNQTGAFGPAVNRIFWSGAGSGGLLAKRYGAQFSGYVGQTLEDVPIGRLAVWAQTTYAQETEFTRVAWDWLSTSFAEGAENEATYFQGAGGFEGRVWLEVESRVLLQRGIPVRKVLNP